jgi:asparagine synthase (glutamine-hydrolysing)
VTLDAQIYADKVTPLRADAPENAVCTRAEEQGVGLVLSGWGGDEGATFNGRGTLAELFLRGRWRTLAREVARAGLAGVAHFLRRGPLLPVARPGEAPGKSRRP